MRSGPDADTTWWRRPALQDATLAVALIVLCVLVNSPSVALTRPGLAPSASRADVVLWWNATGFIAVAVALRRRWPLSMLAVCTVATALHLIRGATFTAVDLGVAVLLYTVAAHYRRAVALTVLTGLLVLVAGWNIFAAATGRAVPGLPDLIPGTARPPTGAPPGTQIASLPPRQARPSGQNAWTGTLVLGSILVASWATGSGTRTRRAYLEELRAHARDVERQRDQQAKLAAAAERARISRELHDVVAHGLSVIVTQAQGAQAALDKRPVDTRTALAAIVKTGRDSLSDMRQAMAKADDVQDAWHPARGLDRLPSLVSQVTAAGTPVRLHTEGTPTRLPSAVDLSAYRLVQEALTNTMRHAGPGAQAAVTISYHTTTLEIDISDDGHRVAADDGHGSGLRGMHERVRLLGGDLTTGPAPTRGFTVHAVLPLQGPGA
jgi:signal transduction histidine kinase